MPVLGGAPQTLGVGFGGIRDGSLAGGGDAAVVGTTRTITIDLELGDDSFAGQARQAGGTGVPFAGWLGLIAALDALIANEGEHAFELPPPGPRDAPDGTASAMTDREESPR
jgi:hypothetical protein